MMDIAYGWKKQVLTGGVFLAAMLGTWVGCVPAGPSGNNNDNIFPNSDELVAGGFAALGDIQPVKATQWTSIFDAGKQVSLKRFDRVDGLGPAYNIVSCAGCHEKPVAGGKSALYRSFFINGQETEDGAFTFVQTVNKTGGVVPIYSYGPLVYDDPVVENDASFRPEISDRVNVTAQRNCIPFLGVGLIAELSDATIQANADPDDADGDGISGRPNFEKGLIGRFGRKAQTTSIEGFIRGPLFNHLGVTTNPLSDEERANLPVDSSDAASSSAMRAILSKDLALSLQAVADDNPTTDNDGVVDPEMTNQELFDLIAFSMLLAAPEAEDISDNATALHGRELFRDIGCTSCHVPALEGPRGKVPAYSDFLIHDMGETLSDGLRQGEATGSEFRTQPLWGIIAFAPYLHDGRAETLRDAILMHGGEGEQSRDQFEALSEDDKLAVEEFLATLGGRSQVTTGLLPPNAPVPAVGDYGGPRRELTDDEANRFVVGRELYDHDFGHQSGVGSPRFNGDSCRACHFDPVIGGAGPRDVNVMRHGIINDQGEFTAPSVGTILHKQTAVLNLPVLPQGTVNIFEHRQTPHTFGLGLIDLIADSAIEANADPDDMDADGVSGRVSRTDDGRLGRFGWKAQVPSVAEFVRDAMAAEIGLTVEAQDGLTFGIINDNDEIADPEFPAAKAEDLAFFISMLASPPRVTAEDVTLATAGEELFDSTGCTKCHVPTFTIAEEGVGTFEIHPYSDFLLHQILADGAAGVEDTSASMQEFRTSPLWGLSKSAPYFHTGQADTLDEAIRMHDGEAESIRTAYENLSNSDREALLAFLNTL